MNETEVQITADNVHALFEAQKRGDTKTVIDVIRDADSEQLKRILNYTEYADYEEPLGGGHYLERKAEFNLLDNAVRYKQYDLVLELIAHGALVSGLESHDASLAARQGRTAEEFASAALGPNSLDLGVSASGHLVKETITRHPERIRGRFHPQMGELAERGLLAGVAEHFEEAKTIFFPGSHVRHIIEALETPGLDDLILHGIAKPEPDSRARQIAAEKRARESGISIR